MNIKLTVKDKWGGLRYCVIDSTKSISQEMEEVLSIKKGSGTSVSFTGKKIIVEDYFSGSTKGEFELVSKEKTNLPLSYKWTVIE